MQITTIKISCDICKEEIKGNQSRRNLRMTKPHLWIADMSAKDVCDNCANKIESFIDELSGRNQNKLVEVEDNYWDKDGRAIAELEIGMGYVYFDEIGNIEQINNWTKADTEMICFFLGNIFKDKESAEAELIRLKQKQTERMVKNDK